MAVKRAPVDGVSDEAEKPFWISYADLMTALMVLFLVVMVVSLLSFASAAGESEALAQKYRRLEARETARTKRLAAQRRSIEAFYDRLEQGTRGLGVTIDRRANLVRLGSYAWFATGSDVLPAAGESVLRQVASSILSLADSQLGQKVFKQAVVEGYADRRGSFLFNLNLSSNRSQRVLCALLSEKGSHELPDAAKRRVLELFVVGGYSFQRAKRSLAASRRVELRLEFLGAGERRPRRPSPSAAFGSCPLDG